MEPLHRLKLICASVIFLQALDLVSTVLGIAAGAVERNPLVHAFGWTPLVLAKFAAVLGLAALPFIIAAMPLPKQRKQTKAATAGIGALAGFYVIVVASNLRVAA